jgi:lysophospholipase L1-like esterase
VPLDQYRANLEALFRRVGEETEAVLIWAKTTPVNERWHHERKGFDRFEADLEAYNAAAVDLARSYGVPVSDLTRAATEAGRDTVLAPDGVHFTPRGYNLLGKAVAACIRPLLRLSP